MKKALYIHGLASGAKSKTGRLLKEHLTDYEWTMAEVNHHCEESLQVLLELIDTLKPDLVCSTSLGGFYTLSLADRIKGQMVMSNPVLDAQKDIRQFVGENRYFCKRLNGDKTFLLTDEDCDAMRPKEFIQKQIEENFERMTVFFSYHDEVLGEDYHHAYESAFGERAKGTTLMGHSMTEDFIVEELKAFLAEQSPEYGIHAYEDEDLYDFEFSYIPRLVANMNEHPEDGAYAALLDNHEETEDILFRRWFKESSEDKESCATSFIEPQDYKVSKQYFPKSGKECLLIEFPEPESVPLAKYGLVCLNSDNKYKYFTLEISVDYPSNEIIWFVCTADVNYHGNYGTLDEEPTTANFIQAVENLLKHN